MPTGKRTLLLPALLICSNGLAQDLLDLPLEELMQISVTSTSYFAQPLVESASSVSYADQSRWQELGARNVGEVLNSFTSTVAPVGYNKTRVIAVRGYFNYAIDTGVATRLDDVPLNVLRFGSGALAIDGYDLSTLNSIELIRGPGSSLHGADAFHGALSMSTVQHGKTGVITRADLGSEDEQAASLVTRYEDEAQQLTAALAYRNIGDQDLTYPYTDPASGESLEGERRNALENQNLLIKYSRQDNYDNEYHLTAYSMQLDADQLLGLGRQPGFDLMADRDRTDYDSQLNLLKLGFKHHYSDRFSSAVMAYYWEYEDTETINLRNAPPPFNFFQRVETRERHWGVQAINRHEFDDNSNLAYGYEYNRAENTDFYATRILASNDSILIPSPQEGASEEYHSLMLDGRLQVDWFNRPGSAIVYGTRFDAYQDYDVQTSPRLGYLMGLSDRTVFKVMVSRSFRKPNTFEVYGNNDSVAPNNELEPETLDNIEVTLQHNSTKLFSSLTLFKNRWHDSIRARSLDTPINGANFQFENQSENEAWGVELEIMARWNRLRLDANASHIISKNVETGLEYEAFPDWMLNLGLGYEFSNHVDLYVFNRFHHRKAAVEEGFGVEPSQGSSTFFRTDVTLNWQLAPTLATHFTIRNLFDRENFMPATFSREDGAPDNGLNASVGLQWQPF